MPRAYPHFSIPLPRSLEFASGSCSQPGGQSERGVIQPAIWTDRQLDIASVRVHGIGRRSANGRSGSGRSGSRRGGIKPAIFPGLVIGVVQVHGRIGSVGVSRLWTTAGTASGFTSGFRRIWVTSTRSETGTRKGTGTTRRSGSGTKSGREPVTKGDFFFCSPNPMGTSNFDYHEGPVNYK